MKKLVYSAAVGNVDITNPDSVKAIKMISKMNGFVAIHPHYPYGTLCLFHSLITEICSGCKTADL